MCDQESGEEPWLARRVDLDESVISPNTLVFYRHYLKAAREGRKLISG